MPLDLERFSKIRPYLYHLTAAQNLESIRLLGELRCARTFLRSAGLKHLGSTKRLKHLLVAGNTGTLLIRDQKPLAAGAIEFEPGWTLDRFVEHINKHVFFWPGTSRGPIEAGQNHFERYRKDFVAVIRIPLADISLSKAAYSRYNSGAPRCSNGRRSPRGGGTYLPADSFHRSPSDVVEVVVPGSCELPRSSEVADSPHGPWQSLFTAA